nr:MAG TPA_asm: hypothetical protein [Caudoviricetes sp.]
MIDVVRSVIRIHIAIFILISRNHIVLVQPIQRFIVCRHSALFHLITGKRFIRVLIQKSKNFQRFYIKHLYTSFLRQYSTGRTPSTTHPMMTSGTGRNALRGVVGATHRKECYIWHATRIIP